MNARDAGRRGGRQRSAAKRAASRRNGALGGRPTKAQTLRGDMQAARAKLADRNLDIDPGDLDLILERLCRTPNSGRRFFIRPRQGGGFVF
ncbi:MAG TPA: hypothetical protein VH143_30745 [Kofleriaceae bacterium]|nr:hypothetical protein [Kofleriaceae bacterium]